MSEGMVGQDPEKVRELARALENSASELESVKQTTGNAVWSFDGWGPNVDQLRGEWETQHAPMLGSIAESLTTFAQRAKANADAQDQTSNTYDGGGSPFAGVSTQGSANAGGGGDDDGGGPLDWLGDKAGDLWDAGGDAVDWVGDKAGDAAGWVGDKAGDAAGWIGDRAGDLWDAGGDAVSWIGDKGSDALGWIGDKGSDALGWLGDRASAIGGSFQNLGDSGMQLWDATGGAILDGEWPRTTEVLASTIRLGGAAVGVGLTAGSLGMFDPKVFDDGDPYAGEPSEVTAPRTPTSVSELALGVTDSYKAADGNIRITTIEGPDGPKVIVSVPGTEAWNPSAGDNPMDVTGNLVTAGGGRSTMSDAVVLAMENANIPPGAEVMMVGHSQGGMTVADLTSDSAFVDKYNVTNAMTYGSPIDSAHIDPSVSVLEMQHQHDAVPRLDLGDSRFPFLPGGQNEGPNHTSVTFDDPGSAWDAAGNHDHSENYPNSMANSTDPGYLAYQQSLRDSGFLTDDPGSVSAVDVHVGRKN
ncbi:hypothetical protein C8K30_105323 [Promicromonospora sp. AC04]|uniref:hypothetical protein n=1 Tax=Promicromonospora sp. AC04 TaxID=2135723 RepID=UPI000D332B32|nr:hypothetical protein [Promicromonospora sp. AC04]PUB27092.1 hypothetical protein C8K30_105323 [Promicromonospora sp. AC04]